MNFISYGRILEGNEISKSYNSPLVGMMFFYWVLVK
jgi:hypothetical protein